MTTIQIIVRGDPAREFTHFSWRPMGFEVWQVVGRGSAGSIRNATEEQIQARIDNMVAAARRNGFTNVDVTRTFHRNPQNPMRRNSDEEVRRLERQAMTGDAFDLDRWFAALVRGGLPGPDKLDAYLRRFNELGMEAWSQEATWAFEELRALAERERTEIAIKDLRDAATVAISVRDIQEALDEAQGSARERTLSADDIVAVAMSARTLPVVDYTNWTSYRPARINAPHRVARSYGYPVSYTVANAYRYPDAVVVVVINRVTGSRGRVLIAIRDEDFPVMLMRNASVGGPCTIISLSQDGDDILVYPGDRELDEILNDAEHLFKDSGIHVARHEELYEACLDANGRVLGASTLGLYDSSPDDGDPLERSRWTFSLAVAEDSRRKGIARALAKSIIESHPRDEILLEGQVVNEHMATMLRGLGFTGGDMPVQREDRYREEDDEVWDDLDRRIGRRMYRSNPSRFVVRSMDKGLSLIQHPEIAKDFAHTLRWKPQ